MSPWKLNVCECLLGFWRVSGGYLTSTQSMFSHMVSVKPWVSVTYSPMRRQITKFQCLLEGSNMVFGGFKEGVSKVSNLGSGKDFIVADVMGWG